MNAPPPTQPPASPPYVPSPDDPVKPGDVLSGKFRVEHVLGVGGMGVVVAATHLQLGKIVALKFMLKAALQYPDNVARFEREARAAVRLRSDHVAKVLDVGRLDDPDAAAGGGAPYMVMEFLEGQDLDRFVRKNAPVPVQTAVDFLLQAAEAIAEAHSLGIVHRDLKPKNLFLTQRLNGEPLVKVLDFGVSKVIGAEGDLSLTATTQVLGSPSYMSPEQLRASRDVDQRTDIWALGAILYELLTGSVPFPAATLTQLTAMVISDPPRPVESLRPDVPAELRAIILRCLEKRPEDRFQSVADLAAALAQFGSATSIALATQRVNRSAADAAMVSGGLGSSSSGAIKAPPDRPSFRAPGANTDVAWDRTQLATSGQMRRRKVLPVVLGVALASSVLGAVAVFAVHRRDVSAGSGTAPPPSASHEPSHDAPLPSVRDPISPPVVPGVERPPPSSVVPSASVAKDAKPAPTQGHPAHKHGAGGAGAPHPAKTNEGDLPNTRN